MRKFLVWAVVICLVLYGIWRLTTPDHNAKTVETANSEGTETGRQLTPPGEPAEYFPFTPGLRLEYLITLGQAEPLNFEIIEWPMGGNRGMASEQRGRFLPHVRKEAYTLILQVEGPAPQQGPFQWDGVKVQVVEDELGIFDNVQELFWSRSRSGDFNIMEVRTYSPDSPGAPTGSWGVPGSSGGNSSRIMFFGGSPGTEMSFKSGRDDSQESPEKLAFLGIDNGGLHFVRTVKEHKRGPDESDDADVLNHGFEEHAWFVRGRGLVRLEQRVRGVPSMTWQLVGSDFNPRAVLQ
jgi:hypothetical protein